MFNKNQNQNISVTSHNQSGGITAHTVNVGTQPRQLSAASAAQLEAQLPKGKPVSVAAVMGDQEAFSFATQITEYLRSKGYAVDGVSQVVYSGPVVGQFIKPTETGFEVVVGGRQV
jgi:hypothetical protein